MLTSKKYHCYPATGIIGGELLSTSVDSEIARYFLENYLQNKRSDHLMDEQIDRILLEANHSSLCATWFNGVAQRTSTDFSALLFAHCQTNKHQSIQSKFITEYANIKSNQLELGDASKRYKILLVPGLFYQSKPETKGDLREVKEVLEAESFEVSTVPILEAGTVEENADIIRNTIQTENVSDKKIILVSASKGGPDTLFALNQLLKDTHSKKIAIWFSIGGALRGSPLADQWIKPPRRWLVSLIGFFKHFSIKMVESLSVAKSEERLKEIQIPDHIRVIHYVGVPLSGTVSREVMNGYKMLSSYGPNDGITFLADEIIEGSTVITSMGMDHWFRDPDLKRKILALLVMVIKLEHEN